VLFRKAMDAMPELSSTSVNDFLQDWHGRLNATEQHQETTRRLLRFYRDLGLLPGGRDEALFACCPHVNGHRFLPSGGHPTSPLTATTSPHRWPSVLPA